MTIIAFPLEDPLPIKNGSLLASGMYWSEYKGHKYLIDTICTDNVLHTVESFFMGLLDVVDRFWDVKEGDVVIDIGSAYGSYSLPALAVGAKLVIAIEPNKSEFFNFYASLLHNDGSNGFADNFTSRCIPLNCLAGSRSGYAAKYYPRMHSIVTSDGDEKWEWRIMHRVDEIVTKYEASRAITQIDWIKVDTEGAEPVVLEGCSEILKKYSPKVLVENHLAFNPNARVQVAAILEPLSYVEDNWTKTEGTNDSWSLWTKKV